MVPPPSLYLTLQPQIVEVGLLLAPVVRRSVRRLERDALLAGLRSHSVFRPTEFVGDQPCWCVALGELSQFARVAVPDNVLKEARERRDLIKKVAEEEFLTSRTFSSGSLAHGTQNDPLNDADAGVVLDRRVYDDLGPDGKGPCAIVEEVRA